jgi:hypothetical protein
VELDRIQAERIYAAYHAVVVPYQDAEKAIPIASTLRDMGYKATALEHHPGDPYSKVRDINLPPDDLAHLKTWLKSHTRETFDAAMDMFDEYGKYIKPLKPLAKPLTVVAGVLTAAEEASASQGSLSDKAQTFAVNATKDIGSKAAIAMYKGDFDAAQRSIVEDVIGTDSVLRSKAQQDIIEKLPIHKESLTAMQNNMRLPEIDRDLAKTQLQYIEARENGNVRDGLSLSSRLTELAEKKVVLQTEWQVSAKTFTTATKDPQTDWAQFKKEHPELVIQADLHVAAKNSGYGQAFINAMDENIAKHTAKGIPMQPIAETLTQASQQQAMAANLEPAMTR